MVPFSQHLEQPGRAHAAADAHCDDDLARAAPLALDQRVADHARARHAVGMADRDRAAIDVERRGRCRAGRGNRAPGTAKASFNSHRSMSSIFSPCCCKQLRHGEDRADPHLVGGAAGDRDAAIDAERLQPAALGLRRLHQHGGRGAVGQLRGVAGGDEPAFLDASARRGTPASAPARPSSVVDGRLPSSLSSVTAHRRGLAGVAVRRPASSTATARSPRRGGPGLRRRGALLRAQRVFVLRLARHLVALGDDLGGLDHRHVEVGPVLDAATGSCAAVLRSACRSAPARSTRRRRRPRLSCRRAMISFAAVAIAISPEAHCRSIDIPAR